MSLIIGPYYSGDPTIKPEPYDNFDMVQSSLFKNAERMGIDPASIALAMPMWNPGDQRDYSKNRLIATNHGTVFSENSLYFDGSSSIYFTNGGANTPLDLTDKFFILQIIKPIVAQSGIIQSISKHVYQLSYSHTNADLSGATAIYIADWYNSDGPNTIIPGEDTVFGGGYTGISAIETYINGKKASVRSIGNKTISNSTCGMRIGSGVASATDGTASSFFTGYIKLTLLFEEYPTEDQIAHLSDNPYALWQRVAPISYFFQSTSGSTLLPIFFNHYKQLAGA